MSTMVAIAVTVAWTGICAIALGFCLRGYGYARRSMQTIDTMDGLAERQARRNLRVERIRVLCQLCGLAVGVSALGLRAGVFPMLVVQILSTLMLIGIALLLMIDSILDDLYRGEVEREEARLLAATIAPKPGGQRVSDPPPSAAQVPDPSLDPSRTRKID